MRRTSRNEAQGSFPRRTRVAFLAGAMLAVTVVLLIYIA
jgi:hypothetical protein